MLKVFSCDVELACDEIVLEKYVSGKKQYALTLISFKENKENTSLLTGFAGDEITERIEVMVKNRPFKTVAVISITFLICCFMAIFAIKICVTDNKKVPVTTSNAVLPATEITESMTTPPVVEITQSNTEGSLPAKIKSVSESDRLAGNDALALLSGKFSDFFCPTEKYSEIAFYGAFEFKAAEGTDIQAMSDGTVLTTDYDYRYGNFAIIDHDGKSFLYANCSNIIVSEGDYVSAGDIIAQVGISGMTAYPRLFLYQFEDSLERRYHS